MCVCVCVGGVVVEVVCKVLFVSNPTLCYVRLRLVVVELGFGNDNNNFTIIW